MRNLRSTQGFTLIELMIVVVIIGILAAIAIPRFSGAAKSAKQAEADPLLKQIYTIQEAYYARRGSYTNDTTVLKQYGWESPKAMEYFTGPTMATAGTGTAATFTAQYSPNPTTGAGLDCRRINQERALTNCS